MEEMFRRFYEDLTGLALRRPHESAMWTPERYYGAGVPEDELQFLEYLSNEYHLNPRPRLVLIVEGNGEAILFRCLVEEIFGVTFSRCGVQVLNLQGIANFTGSKKLDKYGALEKLIDYHHLHQTIVFIVLDNEGRAPQIKHRLASRASTLSPGRTVTKAEYVHLWERNIEFDNCSSLELASALTVLAGGTHEFTAEQVEQCKRAWKPTEAHPLATLFKTQTGLDLPKTELLRVLCSEIIANARRLNAKGEAQPPIVQVLAKVLKLAGRNHPPVNRKIRDKNQLSGYLG